MEITAVATYAMDVLMNVDRLPGEDGFAVVTGNTYMPGGSGTNVLTQAARLGASCGFMGLLGDDTLGNDIVKSLHDEKIDTAAVRRKESGISLHTDIVVDSEGKKFILLNMGNSFLAYEPEMMDMDYLCDAKIFFTDLLPVGPAMAGLKAAKASGLKTGFNMQLDLMGMTGFGATKEKILESLQYVDLFAPCRSGLYGLCGSENLEECLAYLRPYFKGTLRVTLGSQGSVAFDQQDIRYSQPIFPVHAVDTTGAGDAYMGGMLYSYLLKEWPLQEAMEFSTACSAITCQKMGARSGPDLQQALDFVKAYK